MSCIKQIVSAQDASIATDDSSNHDSSNHDTTALITTALITTALITTALTTTALITTALITTHSWMFSSSVQTYLVSGKVFGKERSTETKVLKATRATTKTMKTPRNFSNGIIMATQRRKKHL